MDRGDGIDETTRRKLRGFEFKILCQTLCRGVRADETPGDYFERNRAKIHDLQDLFHWVLNFGGQQPFVVVGACCTYSVAESIEANHALEKSRMGSLEQCPQAGSQSCAKSPRPQLEHSGPTGPGGLFEPLHG